MSPTKRTPVSRERERLIQVLAELVQPLGQALPPSTEVVLQDLSRLPNSIVAVHGDVTGRKAGDPATDLLLHSGTGDELDTVVGYRTQLGDGRAMDDDACELPDLPVTEAPATGPAPHAVGTFANDVDELAAHLIDEAIRDQGVPVELIKKEHKLAIVSALQGRGIYNYLNEIGSAAVEDGGAEAGPEKRTRGKQAR